MEFKGTPGKFMAHTEVAQWYSFDNRFFEVTDEKNQIIAFVKDWNGAGEQPKHDANLPAAAPDLLYSLQKLLTEYKFTRSQLNSDTEEDLVDVLCVRNAMAAINKALGRE